MTDLYDAAIAAYQSAQGNREAEARTVLADVLTGWDSTAMTVTSVEVTDAYTTYVFTDTTISLAVVLRDSGNTVALVKGSPGDWTTLAPVDSLAGLGKVLPGLVPPPPPATGPAAWAPGTAYAVGDEVTYNGATYQCVQGHTSQDTWTPPAVPALWKVV